jgi:hypothetical protein
VEPQRRVELHCPSFGGIAPIPSARVYHRPYQVVIRSVKFVSTSAT